MFGSKPKIIYGLSAVEKAKLDTFTAIAQTCEAAAQQLLRDVIIREKLEKEGYALQFDRESGNFIRSPKSKKQPPQIVQNVGD